MVPAAQLGFNLQPLLEQLSQDELNEFKSLLRPLSLQDELQHIPPTEVEEADGKQLAEILTNHCPSHWVEMVTIQAFDKMNRTDLSEKAKDELRGITRTPEPKCANLEETQQCPGEEEPALAQMQGEDVTDPEEAKEDSKGEEPGKQDEYRSILEEEIWQSRKKNFWPEASENIHMVTQRYETLVPSCNAKMLAGPFAQTVVLHGAAGVGKTTLAKKCMLDWTQAGPARARPAALYLSCKALSRRGPCTLAELLADSAPGPRRALPRLLARARTLLLVIDAFEELRVPAAALARDLGGDRGARRPAPVLLGGLLKRKLLPAATLLVTTRPEALGELRLVVEQPLLVEVEGLSEPERRAYLRRQLGGEAQARRAWQLMRSNAALLRLGSAPAVCWMLGACLRLPADEGDDPGRTCRTATSLLLRFLCSRVAPAPGSCPRPRPRAPLRALCLLAAEGVWAQTSLFEPRDLRRLGVREADLRPFVDRSLLLESGECAGCYRFLHLSLQHLLAAALYVLGGGEGGPGWGARGVRTLLSKEEGRRNPHLAHVGRFLFGLANEDRVRELGAAFGCPVSTELKHELLACTVRSPENGPFSSVTDTRETLCRLYESQDEPLVKEAVAQVTEVSLHLKDPTDLAHASFCLKHCERLQKLRLRVEKGVFLDDDTASGSEAQAAGSQNDEHVLPFWMDLCSIFDSNKDLVFLDISQTFLSTSSVKILCEKLSSATHNLQKVALKNVSPADAYRDFCVVFGGHETLTHLTLQGNDQDDMLPILCEILRHPKCNLQCLRLVSCSASAQQWAHLSSSLEINQSLTCLNLTANELTDESARLLCKTLRHPKCFLQRLSLENCNLTEACCKELSSALIVNQSLTHLCLAKNALGNGGVKLLCEGLSYPDCQLQMLVLWYCSIGSNGCHHLSTLLQQNSSLTHLDLGLNHIGITGLKFLCEALKKPVCNLKCLWLWGCAITPFSCEILASALGNNQSLISLDLGQNSLGYSGVKMLCNTLKLQNSSLRTLRLRIDESDPRIQKLLKEVQESDPQLTIESDKQDPNNNRPSSHDFIF
ncbi:NACHT, LRR and PYD domains-containing protein 2 [Prionailurus viverrinus]|uniref:NACHT, LRR and PYD domains-containing protein 2 n=1 Tax=Prionailurus viverrinus TaxID=61388 RepID=UPI001FF284FE|nr:NACHT, LRR and PYD domains-containing protein 2 [Prionailurus viverrinus]